MKEKTRFGGGSEGLERRTENLPKRTDVPPDRDGLGEIHFLSTS